jgi:BASS family bile acid:Na+ symporter
LDLLNKTSAVVIVVYVAATMAAVGLGYSLRQILMPLRHVRFVLMALLANFVVMPLGSLVVVKLLRLDEPLAEGLLLLGAASGAPLLPSFVRVAKGDVPFAAGTTILLTLGTLGYLPLILTWSFPNVVCCSCYCRSQRGLCYELGERISLHC